VIDAGGNTTYTENFTSYPAVSTNAGGVQGQIIRIELNVNNMALNLAEVQVFSVQEIPVNNIDKAVPTFTLQGSAKISQISNHRVLIQVPHSQPVSYTIYNTMGGRVLRGNTQNKISVVDISGINPGIYLVKVNNAVQKIIKQ